MAELLIVLCTRRVEVQQVIEASESNRRWTKIVDDNNDDKKHHLRTRLFAQSNKEIQEQHKKQQYIQPSLHIRQTSGTPNQPLNIAA